MDIESAKTATQYGHIEDIQNGKSENKHKTCHIVN